MSESDARALLEERDPDAVRFDEQGARWRGHELPNAILDRTRDSLVAVGSCSFREPITDLRSMSLL
jgi:hypothetical protein